MKPEYNVAALVAMTLCLNGIHACVQQQAEVEVEVDLDLNAHTNARAWHGDRKARSAKQVKTVEANERALAVAGKKAQQQLSKVGLPASKRPVRAFPTFIR